MSTLHVVWPRFQGKEHAARMEDMQRQWANLVRQFQALGLAAKISAETFDRFLRTYKPLTPAPVKPCFRGRHRGWR